MSRPLKAPVRNGALDSARAAAIRTLDVEIDGLKALGEALSGALGDSLAAVVELIRDGDRRVIISGMGKSGLIGRKIAATLASTGTPAYFVHPGEASHGDMGVIQPQDVVLALSWSGETAELGDLIAYTRRFDIRLVGLTSRDESALAQAADIALVLPRMAEACPNQLAPTTSTTMQLALGDALAVALLEARGFGSADFKVFHPGGKLGAQLKTVGDIMHRAGAVPLVSLQTSMRNVILEMTAKSFGCAGVTDARGHLVGIVTDGDLRRHVADNMLTQMVEQVMSKAPKTITPDMMAAEALALMNASRITVLFVANGEGAPVGILHLHDLLRLGVA